MQFQVPQFIDIEDKIIGPLTIKQFLYFLVAGVIIFIIYKLLNLFATITLAIPVIAIACLLAFYRPGNQPLMNMVKNFFGFLKKPDFYIWKKPVSKPTTPEPDEIEIIKKETPDKKPKPVAKEDLQDLGWKVEIEK